VSVEGYAPKSSVLATSYVMCIVDRTWYVLFGTVYNIKYKLFPAVQFKIQAFMT
jgi:predicted nuclease of restriction endonuclease-like (RecB) superfamily